MHAYAGVLAAAAVARKEKDFSLITGINTGSM